MEFEKPQFIKNFVTGRERKNTEKDAEETAELRNQFSHIKRRGEEDLPPKEWTKEEILMEMAERDDKKWEKEQDIETQLNELKEQEENDPRIKQIRGQMASREDIELPGIFPILYEILVKWGPNAYEKVVPQLGQGDELWRKFTKCGKDIDRLVKKYGIEK